MKLRQDLQSTGKTIGSLDMLIAAHALALDVVLVTNNIKEFERIDRLKLENWSNLNFYPKIKDLIDLTPPVGLFIYLMLRYDSVVPYCPCRAYCFIVWSILLSMSP